MLFRYWGDIMFYTCLWALATTTTEAQLQAFSAAHLTDIYTYILHYICTNILHIIESDLSVTVQYNWFT